VLADCLDIERLHRRPGDDPPLPSTEAGVLTPQAQILVVTLGLREAQRGVDRGDVDLMTVLQPLVEVGQRQMGDCGCRGRTGNRQSVAARHQRDAELALDLIEIGVSLAVQQRQ